MTGDEFRTIRFKLGLSGLEWGRALGYSGEPNSVRNQIRRYEVPQGRKIPPPIERLAWMYFQYGVPERFRPRR
jgi:hypothetical protein